MPTTTPPTIDPTAPPATPIAPPLPPQPAVVPLTEPVEPPLPSTEQPLPPDGETAAVPETVPTPEQAEAVINPGDLQKRIEKAEVAYKKSLADALLIQNQALTVAGWITMVPNSLAKAQFEALPQTVKDLLGDSLRKELFKLLGEDNQLFLKSFAESKEAHPGAEKQVLACLEELIAKKHLTADILSRLIPAGIHYSANKTASAHSQPENYDEVAHYFHSAGKIVLYTRLFELAQAETKTKTVEDVAETIREALLHEIAHSLLMRDKLVQDWQMLDAVIDQTKLQGEPSPEQAALRSLFDQPERHAPFETPYAAKLMRDYAAGKFGDKAAVAVRGKVLNEILAERNRLFLESDGTFSDFIRLRIEKSDFAINGQPRSDTTNYQEISIKFLEFLQGKPKEATDFATLQKAIVEFTMQSGANDLGHGLSQYFIDSLFTWERARLLRDPQYQQKIPGMIDAMELASTKQPGVGFDCGHEEDEETPVPAFSSALPQKKKTFIDYVENFFGFMTDLFVGGK